MKQTIIIFVLSALTLTAIAKIAINRYGNANTTTSGAHNVFTCTKFDIMDNTITFSRLPKNAIAVYIMDTHSKVALSGTVSRKNNTVNVRQLQPGFYTIVLKQGQKVKIFGYHTDIVIKPTRP